MGSTTPSTARFAEFLAAKFAVLDSDGPSAGTCRWLKVYAADQGRFFTDFAAVYTKLVNTGARWGPNMQA